ncbi:hypothetical protein LVY74_04630 [Acinetobacter sp. ME22]|uniref:hypothetical protein n=1 Tax=Acinetobacter sp. ME22 TaxID=2904802 RepID=UPI001EDB140E|nr:hypothetical protein [Acinetobacter sp. ME22]MCG2572845.1 hypothetical protein [Acinetobacter sp. ME22]
MTIKDQIYRAENLKALHCLHQAGIQHRVIALFMTSEGLPLSEQDVTFLINLYDDCGKVKVPQKKIQAMIIAKKLGQHDDTLPCPV